MKEEIIINGKRYPLWSQFVINQKDWIGGTLSDSGDSMDRAMNRGTLTTTITNIELKVNGEKSAMFMVNGEKFSCGFDVKYGGIIGGDDGYITFSGYGGHSWRIKKPEKK